MAYYSGSGSVIREGAAGIGNMGMGTAAPSFKMPARYSPHVARRAGASPAQLPACMDDCCEEYQLGILTAKGMQGCYSGKLGQYSWDDFESCVSGARKGFADAIECLAWYRDNGYLTPKGFQQIVGASGRKVRIMRGMRGIGEFFGAAQGATPPPVVTAFQDGVFGSGYADRYVPETGGEPGPLESYRDGSMGEYEQAAAGIGMPLFVDGQEVERPITIYHGPGVGQAVIERRYRPTSFYQRPRATLRGLGAAAGGTLDLSDPATIKEVKAALAFAMPELSLTAEGQKVYDEAWYASPLWNGKSSELWASFVKKQVDTGKFKESDLAVTTEKGSYPTSMGIVTMLALGVGSPGYGQDPQYFPKNFPILHAFHQSVVAAGGDTSKVDVIGPFFTEAERVKGEKGGMKVSTMAIIGLGAVAAGAAYLVLRKKK